MHLIQFLLPLSDNAGKAFPKSAFDAVRTELAERFGGVTAYVQSPATGVWADPDGGLVRDDMVLVELMAQTLDREWWGAYRRKLERQFRQEAVLVRALPMEQL
jgi:hypothetical protein